MVKIFLLIQPEVCNNERPPKAPITSSQPQISNGDHYSGGDWFFDSVGSVVDRCWSD